MEERPSLCVCPGITSRHSNHIPQVSLLAIGHFCPTIAPMKGNEFIKRLRKLAKERGLFPNSTLPVAREAMSPSTWGTRLPLFVTRRMN